MPVVSQVDVIPTTINGFLAPCSTQTVQKLRLQSCHWFAKLGGLLAQVQQMQSEMWRSQEESCSCGG